MLDADHLRIVFRLNGVSFIMPVADLLAIRGSGEDELTPLLQSSGALQIGSLLYRDTDVKVYDLVSLFDLVDNGDSDGNQLLIFAGSDYPWAVKVDSIAGVVDSTDFEFQDLPSYLFRDEFVPYHQVALQDGQLLVSVDARQIDQAWSRSE